MIPKFFFIKVSYEPVENESAFDKNFIAYQFNGDRDKTSFDEYLETIKPKLKNVIDIIKESGDILKYSI